MPDAAGEHYEEKFEFPLFKLIKERAEQKDISYNAAADEVVPEWVKTHGRYRDATLEDPALEARNKELDELEKRLRGGK
ncbi:MAG: hypothetical protein ACFFH0_12815 [Promethearchaeota archaeon]